MQNNGEQSKGTKGVRGSTRNASRLKDFAKAGPASGADWGGCSPKRLQGVVTAITALGGAVTFGLSRDMGAHSLTLLLDGDRQTLWYNGGADLDSELESVISTLDAMV